MADSTVMDVNKMKVVELRKELKSRGLSCVGDKAELVARLQTAMSQDEHGDLNLDSDEIDSDSVLEDEDDKSQNDLLDDSAVDTLNEELALSEQPPLPQVKTAADSKTSRILKRKITPETPKTDDGKPGEKEAVSKKIVLNRNISLTSTTDKPVEEKTESKADPLNDNNKIKITAEVDTKTRLELRAKRFGLPIKMSEIERKEARKQRFGQNTSSIHSISAEATGTLSENLEKLKKRAERFGQSVSKIMTDIETKEKLEKRKAKFGAAVNTNN